MEVQKIARSYGFLTFYFTVIPLGLYFLLNFLLATDSPSYPKVLAVYGYSMGIFIPVSFLFLIPTETLRWIFLITAGLISLWILFKELVFNGMEYLEEAKIYMIGALQ